MVMIASPAGCEEALRMLAEGSKVDLPALAARLQIEVLGPPMLSA
jgi:hypothetical protein